MSTNTESLAEELAGQGRDELVRRFRDAYSKAAATHGDLITIESDRIEVLVQRAVHDADGLQWRRALAGLASEQLGIGLGEALTHPAVVRAHQIVGAPSYERALAQLAVPVPTPTPPAKGTRTALTRAPDPVASQPEAVREPAVASMPEPVDTPEAEALDDGPGAAADPEPALASVAEDRTEQADQEDKPEANPEVELKAEVAHEAAGSVEPTTESEPEAPVQLASAPGADPDSEAEAPEQMVLVQPTIAYSIPAAAPADAVPEAEAVPEADADTDTDTEDDGHGGDDDDPDEEFTYEHATVDDEPGADGDLAEFEAVHVSGVASLPANEEIAVRLSADGLDLLRADDQIVGRLGWNEIEALEVTVPHGRRRKRGAPRLVVHTAGGSARFEVPGLTGEELQEQVQPVMVRFGH